MRTILILFVFAFVNFVDCREEYVTVWAPNKVYDEKNYNVVLLSNDLDKRTEIAIQFRRSFGTLALAPEKLQNIRVPNRDKTGAKKEFELFMTLHRNESTPSGLRQKCMTQTLQKIEAEKRTYYTFIQTDKPIYKPGDTVRFRVVVVDRDLKPYHMNNININVTDSLNRPIKEFDDLEEMYNGVFTGKFDLDRNTPLGVWKVRVVIDKIEQWEVFKEIAVQKFTLPPFAAYITTKDRHLLTNSVLQLSFYAKYSFEDFVRGSAQLTIKCTTNNQVVITKSFSDITGIHNAKFKVHEDLKATTTTKLDYEATIMFTEPESGITANKTVKFTVHADNSPKIKPNYPEKFMPGLPFGVKVFVFDWKETLIKSSYERVKIYFYCVLQNGANRTMMADGVIKKGVAIHNFIIPKNVDSLKMRLKYLEVTYEKNIEKGSVVVGVNKIIVDYLPKNPNYGDIVNIHVRAHSELDQLVAVVMSRHGNIESHQVYCNFYVKCKFNITVRKDMMPESKVLVYHVKDRGNIHQGETTIKTEELGRNTLDIKMPESAQTKKKVDMEITTKPDSTVYMLGFDKRLTYLFQGNEIKKDDVVKELANYDGYNKVAVLHMNRTNWHDCTEKELKRLALGRRYVDDHGDDANTDDDMDEDLEGDLESERNEEETPTASADDISKDFGEVWLFEEFDVPDGEITKTFTTPDSITSWMISSFSMNAEHGLAIAQPLEIVIKNQFFIKVAFPYSIRYNEKLRVDVMVYNYVNTEEPLDVKVVMYDAEGKDSFRFFDDEYSSTPSSNTKPSKTVKVPYDNARKVSFYIQAGSDRKDFEKIVKVRIDATAQTRHGDTFQDKMLRRLKVEPVGVKTYDIDIKSHNLKGIEKSESIEKNMTNLDEPPKFIVKISGDYLTDDMSDANLGHELYPSHGLEQKTSVLKANVEHFRYLKSKNANPSTTLFSTHYQSLLDQKAGSRNYATASGYRSYFIEAIASAMEIGALPVNKPIIESELDALKGYQTESGNFNNFGNIPDSRSEYFKTAYVLIPFLKFKKFIDKNYNDVISKGFRYLNGIHGGSGSDMEAYSIAALAYALNGNNNQALELLKEVEKAVIRIDQHRKCFKLSKAQAQCDRRHTSYAAIAYLTMDKYEDAKALITYILGEYKMLKEYRYTYAYAISTEAISKFLIATPIIKPTDFTVTLSNELNFSRDVHITQANQKDPVEVVFPDYTLHPKMTIRGHGYCSLTKIIEKTIAYNKTISKFNLKVTPFKALLSNERTVQICATYHPHEDEVSLHTLFNVIYDVEMPSGYIFKEIVNMENNPEIKLAAPRLERTRVQIYYNDFESGKNYCIDIKGTKFFDVKDVQNAGVMVYDYNDKENAAIQFYKLDSNACKP